MEFCGMKANPASFSIQGEVPELEGRFPELRPLPDEIELSEEEAFYRAQEEAFAHLRARQERRPRKKI
jgi:hypothetical protein